MGKMKQLFLFTILFFMIMLAACSSPEADEVLDYHNDFVDNVNPKIEEIEALNTKVVTAQTEEEALEIQKNKVTPLIHDIKDYVASQKPETDVAKEYHQIRLDWANAWSEAVDLENEAFSGLIDGSMTEDEAGEVLQQSEEKSLEVTESGNKANEKWEEIKKEYDFEDEEEKSN